MKLPRGKMFLITAGVVAVGVLVWAFRAPPVEVGLASVTRGPLTVTIDHEGKTRIKQRYIVSAPLAGRLQRIDWRAGDSIEAGKSLLAVIEPADPALLDARSLAQAEARVKGAEAAVQQGVPNVEHARAMWEMAKDDFSRASKVASGGVISKSELEAADHKDRAAAAQLRTAEFAAQIAQFELEQARAALMMVRPPAPHGDESPASSARFEIRPPVTGRVLRVLQESTTIVTPGAQLLEIGDPADLEIVVDVLSTDAVKVAADTRVIIEHWGGEGALDGRVRVVEPSAFTKVSSLGVEEQRVNVVADFVDPPAKRAALGDGFRIEARLVVWQSEEVLKVPAGALFRTGNDWSLFTVSDGAAHLRRIHAGHRNDSEVEIINDLKEGEQVILYPGDKVADGGRVQSR